MKHNNIDHMKNKDLEPAVIEKHEGRRLRDYWRKFMDSTHNKLSRGSEYICKCRTSPHKDNWRGSRKHPEHVGRAGHGKQERKK